jgi:hypothetical protein
MNIVISYHARKRRVNHKLLEKDILINLVKDIDNRFNISKKTNGKYKVGYKGTVAIIKKSDDMLILITAYGFSKYDYNIDKIDLKLSTALSKKDRESKRNHDRGIIHTIFRINYLEEIIACGTISNIHNSKDSRDKRNQDKYNYKISLNWKLFIKFKGIPMSDYHLYFNDFSEISNIVHLENNMYFLNGFARKDKR